MSILVFLTAPALSESGKKPLPFFLTTRSKLFFQNKKYLAEHLYLTTVITWTLQKLKLQGKTIHLLHTIKVVAGKKKVERSGKDSRLKLLTCPDAHAWPWLHQHARPFYVKSKLLPCASGSTQDQKPNSRDIISPKM